jgi:hypothetical protein
LPYVPGNGQLTFHGRGPVSKHLHLLDHLVGRRRVAGDTADPAMLDSLKMDGSIRQRIARHLSGDAEPFLG